MGLVAKQISVCTRFLPQGIGLARMFAQRQGDGAIWPTGPDFADQVSNPCRALLAPFSALHHKCAESQFIALFTACQHLLPCERVAHYMAIAAPYATIQAIVAAHVGQLNKATQVDSFAKLLLGHLTGLCHQVVNILRIVHGEQRPIFFRR